VTLDWQANRKFWLNDDPKKTTCEAANARNCAELKQAGKVKRCTIYHNMELALEWLESNRAVMDQVHVEAGWFLKYKNGTVYDDVRQPPAGPPDQPMPWLSQWFIDWRNQDAAAYFVEEIVNATFLPGVDGTFPDDSQGVRALLSCPILSSSRPFDADLSFPSLPLPRTRTHTHTHTHTLDRQHLSFRQNQVPAEHSTLAHDLGVTNASLYELQFATQEAGNYLATSLAAAGASLLVAP
jgi:hypothetical protein